ncbi:MAG: DUF2254 domain-containing protein [Planctomycetaceae bacterium]
MNTWLLNLFDRLRNSLWFVPAMGLAIALIASIGLLNIDDAVRVETIPGLSWATTTGPAARATLSSLAGALVTVTGVVFSITMLTLAQTSAMYGSRLLRSFLNHNITQVTLATFLGTSLYCFAILRAIREVDEGTLFVPHLSVGVGMLGGLGSLTAFVYFIHHVAQSIQAQSVVRNVAHELDDAIDRLFPEQMGDADDETPDDLVTDEGQDHTVIESTQIGYLQAIDGDTLMELATEHNLLVRLLVQPGDFIAHGRPIISVDTAEVGEERSEAMNECFLTGSRRTPRQDVECALNELVEVAVRALSPGINDPHTAIACIDYLGASLMRLAQRRMPSPLRYDDENRLRIIARPVTFSAALNAAFDEIRQHGRVSTAVTIRLAETLRAIAETVTRPSDRDAILRQTAMLERSFEDALPEQYDRADVRERLREIHDIFDHKTESDDAHGSKDT